ncbi:MAG: hypothetical protein CL789_01640 [Chloroflexi bacterium]|nr:hypothetical protein [Chloroflexota bacterium]HCU80807.1 hypothetical protein [Chloroflexota bacterium]
MNSFIAAGNFTLDDVVTSEGLVKRNQLGGNGVYSAAGMRLWGVNVILLSVVGDDFPVAYLDTLSGCGIDISGVSVVSQRHELRSRAFYFPDGSRTDVISEAKDIITERIAGELDLVSEYPSMGSSLHRTIWPVFTPDTSQVPKNLGQVGGAHLAPGNLDNNRRLALIMKQMSHQKIVISYDWPWWEWDCEGQDDANLLAHIDYLMPSIEEANIYSGPLDRSAPDALRDLLIKYDLSSVLMKKGALGSSILVEADGEWIDIPAFPTNAKDPTGAGDAFCGGFQVGLFETGDPVQAALYGAVSASFVIEEFSPTHACLVNPDNARKRLAKMRSMMSD